ncbi:MAG: hypothetical protein A2271_05015 [Candidatus Moranbacteria bacterium RIFOXYA12_FULL_35_19]|nr:MAG: hypothetical protein UR78_C0025G0008 [Candidatus Moranbacteria bacterium GW2011_GWF2_35_39]OGI32950.1 MAG: hypothetical protein A2489_00870 [Candidatus Moranbacteria bacterium RIFOXYC12_FULL_36_13]OGI36226.1 MAG: hypothetical protein A2271_05015 [Candidatus Moranbacteria bacterium RIFOXYA12_FULL_35_19]
MIIIKTKDGDILNMFRNCHGKFKIISSKRGIFGDGYSVVFCKKNPSRGKGLIIENGPSVGLFFIVYKYTGGIRIKYKHVSKEIIEVSQL